jgi:hypothetical protein
MSSGAPLLDDDLLDQFEATLRTHRIGILEAWAPGLTDEQIDAAIAGTDLQLPDEVRTWWRRHDGLVSHRVPVDQIDLLPSNREPMSLQNAVAAYQQRGGDDQRLLIVNGRPEILVACRERGEDPAPVYWDRYDDFVSPAIAAPSLGALILVWMEYIDRGVYAVSPHGGWADDQPLLVEPPEDVVKRGLW